MPASSFVLLFDALMYTMLVLQPMADQLQILVIEDEQDIAELLDYNLLKEGYKTLIADRGKKGLEMAQRNFPDLILLDLMLPDMSGIEVCRAIRENQNTKDIPIIMLTAKSEESDRLSGFETGADDYVTKPFSPRELLLRIKAVAKRFKVKRKNRAVIEFGVLVLDEDRYEVKVNGKAVVLTSLEFKLLKYFLSNKGRLATREILLDKVWGYDAELTTRTVDTHIKRLREKIGEAGDYIETIRGMGYRFKDKVK